MTEYLTIHLSLICSATGESSSEQLTLETLPPLGADLKREIERANEIPSFAQTLAYGSDSAYAELADDDSVSAALLRHGDSLRVTYTSKAECREVGRAVDYLEQLVASFREQFPSPSDSASHSATLLNQLFSSGIGQLLRNVSCFIAIRYVEQRSLFIES